MGKKKQNESSKRISNTMKVEQGENPHSGNFISVVAAELLKFDAVNRTEWNPQRSGASS